MLNNIAQYPTRQSFNSTIDKVDRMDKIMPVVRTEFSRASEDTYILYGFDNEDNIVYKSGPTDYKSALEIEKALING